MMQLEQFQPKGSSWSSLAEKGKLAAVIDPADTKGKKNAYIDILHKLALSKHIDNIKSDIVLDLGCGTGRFLNMLAQKAKFLIGIEITEEMLKIALSEVRYPNVDFILFDGINLPVEDRKIDLIVTVGVMQHINNNSVFQKIISELKRCLKPGGRILSIEQACKNKKGWRRNHKEYLKFFKKNSFRILNTYSIRRGHSLILYPILLGIIPVSWFKVLARMEIWWRRNSLWHPLWDYEDYLFEMELEDY